MPEHSPALSEPPPPPKLSPCVQSTMLASLVWLLLAAPARSACALENGTTVLNWKARILLADSGLGSYGGSPAITLNIETPASFTGAGSPLFRAPAHCGPAELPGATNGRSGDDCWDRNLVFLRYTSDCAFSVTDEGQDRVRLSGTVEANASRVVNWFGLDFTQTFQFPLSFTVRFATTVVLNSTTTALINNTNDCYLTSHCYGFECVLVQQRRRGLLQVATGGQGVNFCNCSTVDPNGEPGVCTGVVHADADCGQDTAAPISRDCPHTDLVIDLRDHAARLSLATLGGPYGPAGYQPPSWCDCTSPLSPELYQVTQVYRAITPPVGARQEVLLGVPGNASFVYDHAIASYVFGAKGAWRVEYLVRDIAGNLANCSFWVRVVDSSPPNLAAHPLCQGGRTLQLRGHNTEPYLDPVLQAGGNLSVVLRAQWAADGFESNNLRLLQSFSDDLCAHADDNIDNGSTHCAWYSYAGQFAPLLQNFTSAFGGGDAVRPWLPDGVYTVAADVTDEAGNVAWCNFSVSVDNVPPALDCASGLGVYRGDEVAADVLYRHGAATGGTYPGTRIDSWVVLLEPEAALGASGWTLPLTEPQLRYASAEAATQHDFVRAVQRTQPGRGACPGSAEEWLAGDSTSTPGGTCVQLPVHAGHWYQVVPEVNGSQSYGATVVTITGPAGCNGTAQDELRSDYLGSVSAGCYPREDGNATFCVAPAGAGYAAWGYWVWLWGCDLGYELAATDLYAADAAAAGAGGVAGAGLAAAQAGSLRARALFRAPAGFGSLEPLPYGWSLRVGYAAYDDHGNVAVCLVDYEVRDTQPVLTAGAAEARFELPPDFWNGGELLATHEEAALRRSLVVRPQDLWLWSDYAVEDHEALLYTFEWTSTYTGTFCGLAATATYTGGAEFVLDAEPVHGSAPPPATTTVVPPNTATAEFVDGVSSGELAGPASPPDPGLSWLQRRRGLAQVTQGSGLQYQCLDAYKGFYAANAGVANQTLVNGTTTYTRTLTGRATDWLYLYPGVTYVTLTVADAGYWQYNFSAWPATPARSPPVPQQLVLALTVVDVTPPVFLDCAGGVWQGGARTEVTIPVGSAQFWLHTGSDELWPDFGLLRVRDNAVLNSDLATAGPREYLSVSPSYGFGQWLSYGEHNVTYTAVDPSGNWATCTRRLFVRDVQAPSLSCGANGHLDPVFFGNASYLVAMDPGSCGVLPTTADGFGINYTSSDVQGPVQVVVECAGDGLAGGQGRRRHLAQLGVGGGGGGPADLSLSVQCVAVATDQAGNNASCLVGYDTQDREAPVVHCHPTCTVQLRTVAGFAGCFDPPTDNCAYNDTSYSPGPAAIAWLSFADSPFTLYSTGSDDSPYSPASATCETVVTLSGYCGDGLLDFYGAHGPAEQCELSPHPESFGCTSGCTCGAGYVADPQGGCLQACAAGSACPLVTSDLQGTDCASGTVTTSLPGSPGTAWTVDALKPDFTAVRGAAYTDFYVVPNGLGTRHVSYRHWERNTSSSPYVGFNATQVQQALLLPDEQLVLEWYLTTNTVEDVADPAQWLRLEVCACDFQNASQQLAAFVLLADGTTLAQTDTYCTGGGQETTYNPATACWAFAVCRTGVVVLGVPASAAGNLLQCLDTSTIVVNNSASGCSWAPAAWTLLGGRVQLNPGTTFGDLQLVSTGVPSALWLNQTSLEEGHFLAAQTTSVTVRATGGQNFTDPGCTWLVTVLDVVPPVVTCELANTSNATGLAATYGNDPGHNYSVLGGYRRRLLVDELDVSREIGFDEQLLAATLQLPLYDAGDAVRFYVGTTTLVFAEPDSSGNDPVPCVLSVEVRDVEPPVLACPDLTVNTLPGLGYWNGTSPDVTVTDNFDATVVTTYPLAEPLAYTGPGAFHTLARTYTDTYGNTGSCQFDVWVLDNQAPVFTVCPDTQVQNISVGTAGYDLDLTAWYTATDNSDPALSFTYEVLAGQNYTNYTQTLPLLQISRVPYELTARITAYDDHSGLSTQCTLRFALLDNAAPALACPAQTVDLVLSEYYSYDRDVAWNAAAGQWSFGVQVDLEASLAAPIVLPGVCAVDGGSAANPFAPCPNCTDNHFDGCAGLTLQPVVSAGIEAGGYLVDVALPSNGYATFQAGWSVTDSSANVYVLDTCEFRLVDDLYPYLYGPTHTAGAWDYNQVQGQSSALDGPVTTLHVLHSRYAADADTNISHRARHYYPGLDPNVLWPQLVAPSAGEPPYLPFYARDQVALTSGSINNQSLSPADWVATAAAFNTWAFRGGLAFVPQNATATPATVADLVVQEAQGLVDYWAGRGQRTTRHAETSQLAFRLAEIAYWQQQELRLGTNYFTGRFGDESGNEVTFTFICNLEDSQLPVFYDCPASEFVLSTSSCDALDNFTDRCTFANVTLNFGDDLYLSATYGGGRNGSAVVSPGTVDADTTRPLALTVDDEAGNERTCGLSFRAVDDTPPRFVDCPPALQPGWNDRTVRIPQPGQAQTTLPTDSFYTGLAGLAVDNVWPASLTTNVTVTGPGGGVVQSAYGSDEAFHAGWAFAPGVHTVSFQIADQALAPNVQPERCTYTFEVLPAYDAPQLTSLVLSYTVARVGNSTTQFTGTVDYVLATNFPYVSSYNSSNGLTTSGNISAAAVAAGAVADRNCGSDAAVRLAQYGGRCFQRYVATFAIDTCDPVQTTLLVPHDLDCAQMTQALSDIDGGCTTRAWQEVELSFVAQEFCSLELASNSLNGGIVPVNETYALQLLASLTDYQQVQGSEISATTVFYAASNQSTGLVRLCFVGYVLSDSDMVVEEVSLDPALGSVAFTLNNQTYTVNELDVLNTAQKPSNIMVFCANLSVPDYNESAVGVQVSFRASVGYQLAPGATRRRLLQDLPAPPPAQWTRELVERQLWDDPQALLARMQEPGTAAAEHARPRRRSTLQTAMALSQVGETEFFELYLVAGEAPAAPQAPAPAAEPPAAGGGGGGLRALKDWLRAPLFELAGVVVSRGVLALVGAGVLLCCLCVFSCVGGHRVLYHRTCWGRNRVPSEDSLSKRQRRPEARGEYEGPNPLSEAYRDNGADVQHEEDDEEDDEDVVPSRALP